eukprot:UN33540
MNGYLKNRKGDTIATFNDRSETIDYMSVSTLLEAAGIDDATSYLAEECYDNFADITSVRRRCSNLILNMKVKFEQHDDFIRYERDHDAFSYRYYVDMQVDDNRNETANFWQTWTEIDVDSYAIYNEAYILKVMMETDMTYDEVEAMLDEELGYIKGNSTQAYLVDGAAGITVYLSPSGTLSRIEWFLVLVTLVSVVVLFSIATIIIEILMLYVLPNNKLYYQSKFEFTEDLDDLTKQNKEGKQDLENIFKENAQKLAGQAVKSVNAKMEDIKKKSNYWRCQIIHLMDELYETFRIVRFQKQGYKDVLDELNSNIVQGWEISKSSEPKTANLVENLVESSSDSESSTDVGGGALIHQTKAADIIKVKDKNGKDRPYRFAEIIPELPRKFQTIVFTPTVPMKWKHNHKAENFCTPF